MFKKESQKFLIGLAYTVLWLISILIQPDFGTAFIYLAVFMLLVFTAGISWKWLLGSAFLAGATAIIFIQTHPYAQKRLAAFLNPSTSWHLQQLELASARGGWTGSKIGQALWSNAYVPLPYNDSAYATLTETIGFAGAFLVLLLFAILLGALSLTALRRDLSENARLFAAGCAIIIGVQALLHIGVNGYIILRKENFNKILQENKKGKRKACLLFFYSLNINKPLPKQRRIWLLCRSKRTFCPRSLCRRKCNGNQRRFAL